MKNIMLDLETLGTRPGCIVLSIGAVTFSRNGTHEEFYSEISQSSSASFGLQSDPATVSWWDKQEGSSRGIIERTVNGGVSLVEALLAFNKFALDRTNERDLMIWGDGAAFDNVILFECFRVCGIKSSWPYWNDRCYRTLKNLGKHIPIERSGTLHNALDDARTQAIHAVKVLSWIYGLPIAAD